MSADHRQWLRFAEVIVGARGTGLRVVSSHKGGLRVTFKVDKSVRHTPNQANILIYNLHPDDEKKVLEEYDAVILNVGYSTSETPGTQDSPRVIFRGNIKRAFAWWDKGDRVTEVQAADGDKDYREAIVNETLAAGSNPLAEVAAILRAMGATGGTKEGYINVRQSKRLRGKVMSGSAKSHLHRIADDNFAHWSIQDGFLQIVPSTGTLPSEAIVVNEDTGMIGAPTISDKGVQVKALLNPQIACNGALKLDNENIKIQETQLYTNGPKTKPKNLVRLSPDGVYKVYKLTHAGDTRGEDWETTAECVAVGAAIPSNTKKKAAPKI